MRQLATVKQATILLPVDGSSVSEHAARHLIALSRTGMTMKVHLLNVQPEPPPARSEYERREAIAVQVLAANKATEGASSLLAGAGVEYERHIRIGVAADVIVRLAREKRCQKIVMGTRRLGTVSGFLTGSVAGTVLRVAAVPVTLVRQGAAV